MNYFSDFSIWWLIPLLFVAIGLSYFYYFKTKQKEEYSTLQLKILTGIRAFGLFILTVLLLGLVWETITFRQEKPLFVTMVDQSASMLNYSDSSVVKKQIENYRSQLQMQFGDEFELVELNLGEQVKPAEQGEFTDKQTDLASGFEYIRELYFNRNIGGVCLISDGNYNKGVHPMYQAERLELTPIFALGVGDTLNRKDQLIRNVNSNEIAFVNNSFPIEVLIDFNRMPKGNSTVLLKCNGQTIQKQTVSCANSQFDQKEVIFTVEAKKKGFQRYTVVLEGKQGEFTLGNNSQSIFIEILDNRNEILLLTSGPHPDIAAIRAVLEEDKQAKIQTDNCDSYVLKGNAPDIVVWYENGNNSNIKLFNDLISRKIPVFLILSPTVPTTLVQSLNLGLKAPKGSQTEDVYPTVSQGFSAFELTEECTSIFGFVPPLKTRFGGYGLPTNAQVALNQRVGSITKKDPLLFFTEKNTTKVGVLLGEGIWRWKMKEFMQRKSINGFRELIQKTTQYLSVKQNREPLKVVFPKRFTISENVEVKAEYYNESMELITTPEITLTLQKEGGKPSKQLFSTLANFYKVNAGQLEPGTYKWTVKATRNGKVVSKSGDFVVDDISIESLDTKANFSVLTQLTSQSDGKFERLKNADKLIKEIAKRKDIAVIQYSDSGFANLIDKYGVFILLILLFSSEWFLRRWWGNY